MSYFSRCYYQRKYKLFFALAIVFIVISFCRRACGQGWSQHFGFRGGQSLQGGSNFKISNKVGYLTYIYEKFFTPRGVTPACGLIRAVIQKKLNSERALDFYLRLLTLTFSAKL